MHAELEHQCKHERECEHCQRHQHDDSPDLMDERMLQMFRSLRVKIPVPTFRGDNSEDPTIFKTKALNYMEATDVPRGDRVHEFCHLLEGKAHLWYDEIDLPQGWNNLMQQFCARFSIFDKESEDWYHHWSALHFDPALDADIDDLINQVKTLARLLNFPPVVVLATLKNMFPQHHLHFFNVNDLPMMYRMLRAMFPRNRNQAIPGATGGSPFSAHQEQNLMVLVTKRSPSKPKLAEISQAQATQFENAVDRLEDTIERFNMMTDRKEKNGSYHPNDCSCGRKCPPFKPTITRHQCGHFSHSAPPPHRREQFPQCEQCYRLQ